MHWCQIIWLLWTSVLGFIQLVWVRLLGGLFVLGCLYDYLCSYWGLTWCWSVVWGNKVQNCGCGSCHELFCLLHTMICPWVRCPISGCIYYFQQFEPFCFALKCLCSVALLFLAFFLILIGVGWFSIFVVLLNSYTAERVTQGDPLLMFFML